MHSLRGLCSNWGGLRYIGKPWMVFLQLLWVQHCWFYYYYFCFMLLESKGRLLAVATLFYRDCLFWQGKKVKLFYNPAATKLVPNEEYGIAFNGNLCSCTLSFNNIINQIGFCRFQYIKVCTNKKYYLWKDSSYIIDCNTMASVMS